ncbi:MAG: class I SAM-dependent methyltransferase [Spirochaetes bacterium]|nr:class I SAM-dependent methyltransferase [Spirochaetota bacterium]
MDTDRWWSTWAPLWERIEDRHFGTLTTDSLIGYIKPKVLVVGAGLGLIVRHLAGKNIGAVGLDINPEMVRMAKEKYGVDIIEGDAGELPFTDKSFNTVIISSGVVDYGADGARIISFVDEASRVCSDGGAVLAAFYKLPRKIERIYRRIGVIDKKSIYHMDRIFTIDVVSAKNPLLCVPYIRKWTGKFFIRILFEWMWIGMTLHISGLIAERDWMRDNISYAESIGIRREDLVACVPDALPYRARSDIQKLFEGIRVEYSEIIEFEDCTVVVIET